MKKALLFLLAVSCFGQAEFSSVVFIPSTDPTTGLPSAPGISVFQDTESTPKTVTIAAPTTVTASYALALPTTQAAGAMCNDGSGNLSFGNCGGLWVLSSSNIFPSGNYNVLPTGSATFGNPTNYWTQSYSVQDFAGTYYVTFGTYPFNNQGWFGYDSVSQQLAVVNPVGGASFEFGNGTTATKANVTYNDLLPDTTNVHDLGGPSARWAKVNTVDLDISGTCTGCGGTSYFGLSGSDLSPSGTYNILPNGSANLGAAAGPYWNDTFSTQVYSGTYYYHFGTYPFDIQGYTGWDSANSQIAVVTGSGGATWEFGNGTLGTKENVTYNPIAPSVNDTQSLGDSGREFLDLYIKNIHCTGTCPGGGSVASVATTGPITGGTITSTGTIACPTCATFTNGGNPTGTSPITFNATTGAIGCATCLTSAVMSVATSGPITGGTITGTGTIGCSTCLTTTGGQTISGAETFTGGVTVNSSTLSTNTILPTTNNVWALGNPSGFNWASIAVGGVLATSGYYMGGTQVIDSSRDLINIAGLSGTFNMSGNMTITQNFYNRTFSGAPSCSGVANGWMGYDTSSNILWVCNGGTAEAH